MLHGSPSDHARAMAHLEPAFRQRTGWRRIYPDLPGHGRTPGTDRIRDMDDYLDVVVELVDELFDGGRFSLGGNSFGAYLALGVARRRPARLEGLLLSVPEINHSPVEDRRDRAASTPSIQTPRRFARGLPPYREDTAWLEALPFRDVHLSLYQSARPVRVPALFLFGRQDASFRVRTYWRMFSDFPHATWAILDGASHTLWNDRGGLATVLVGDWLDRIEERARRRARLS